MTSGKKVALSLLISILIFSAFALLSFVGLFSVFETKFYQPAVISNMKNNKKILAINFGGIGDEILFLPTLISLKKEFPNSSITLALEPRSKGVLLLFCIGEGSNFIS